MLEYSNSRAARIIGPDRRVLTRNDLPAPNTTRWVASRKAKVVTAVEGGLITLDEALFRYNLSIEEFRGWQHAMDRSGIAGLRVGARQRIRQRANDQVQLPARSAQVGHLPLV
ncbi:MAG: DUF1153 domain-containing protein [Novosphingobium sp.]|jgi:hypothetical protein|nr:DUF1153 domain-containing protein [Brevundimonas sp.]MCZ8322949.1 DUF1153 domain-containing protein [Novosphingobium sp.]